MEVLVMAKSEQCSWLLRAQLDAEVDGEEFEMCAKNAECRSAKVSGSKKHPSWVWQFCSNDIVDCRSMVSR